MNAQNTAQPAAPTASSTWSTARSTTGNPAPRLQNRRLLVALVGFLATVSFSACTPSFGGETIESAELDAVETAAEFPAHLYANSTTRAVVDVDELTVYDTPNGAPMATLSSVTPYGTPRVLLIVDSTGDWIRVRLPMRPNHRTGWVKASDVTPEKVDPVVHIDLDSRTLTVVSDETVIAQATVAIGSDENPTPLGTFYITDKLETPDPGGAYGPFAFGLSGYSETLSEFAGGDGQIGIHGTNNPDSLGQAVSHGCIRLPNEVVVWLADFLPLGTPVHIV